MKTIITMIGVLLALSQPAQAGGVGNGGVAYVCRNSQTQKITKAQLLDLWEPDTQEIDRNNKVDPPNQRMKALDVLASFFPYGKLALLETINNIKIAPAKKTLQLTNDALPVYAPEKNCGFEQVAWYGYDYETRQLLLKIDYSIYDNPAFSYTDRAALIVHEALYKIARKNWKLEDSRFVRSVVALLFAESTKKDSLLSARRRMQLIDPGMRYAIAQLFVDRDCDPHSQNLDLTAHSKCNAVTIPVFEESNYKPDISVRAQLPKLETNYQRKWDYKLEVSLIEATTGASTSGLKKTLKFGGLFNLGTFVADFFPVSYPKPHEFDSPYYILKTELSVLPQYLPEFFVDIEIDPSSMAYNTRDFPLLKRKFKMSPASSVKLLPVNVYGDVRIDWDYARIINP